MKQRSGGERKIRLKNLNSCITCIICNGYMVEATTITECLHTFCKSCIVKFLEENNSCPKCQLVIHQSHPLNYISHDRTMHDIVYKLVPSLREDELRREEEFYKKAGIQNPKNTSIDEKETSSNTKPSKKLNKNKNNLNINNINNNHGNHNNHNNYHHNNNNNNNTNQTTNTTTTNEENEEEEGAEEEDFHRYDEQVSLCLVCDKGQLQQLKRKYIRCSVQTTITHLKKFLALKLFNDMTKFKEIELMCNKEIMGKDHTLKFICMTRWRNKSSPLLLHYRPTLEL